MPQDKSGINGPFPINKKTNDASTQHGPYKIDEQSNRHKDANPVEAGPFKITNFLAEEDVNASGMHGPFKLANETENDINLKRSKDKGIQGPYSVSN